LYGLKSALRIVPRSRPVLSVLPKMSTRLASHAHEQNIRPESDKVIQDISDYVHSPEKVVSPLARETARLCLIDTLGCGLEALRFKQCTKLLGPVVEGNVIEKLYSNYQAPLFQMELKYPGRIINLILFEVLSILVL
jgi:hypothetical protein